MNINQIIMFHLLSLLCFPLFLVQAHNHSRILVITRTVYSDKEVYETIEQSKCRPHLKVKQYCHFQQGPLKNVYCIINTYSDAHTGATYSSYKVNKEKFFTIKQSYEQKNRSQTVDAHAA